MYFYHISTYSYCRIMKLNIHGAQFFGDFEGTPNPGINIPNKLWNTVYALNIWRKSTKWHPNEPFKKFGNPRKLDPMNFKLSHSIFCDYSVSVEAHKLAQSNFFCNPSSSLMICISSFWAKLLFSMTCICFYHISVWICRRKAKLKMLEYYHH